MKHLNYFNSHSEYTDPTVTPNVSYCKLEDEVHYNPIPYDYSQDYLTFVALENTTFGFEHSYGGAGTISYSIDDGNTWVEGSTVTVSSNNKVMWKGNLTASTSEGSGTFSSTGNFDIQGNVMSLLFNDNFENLTDLTGKNYAFSFLFYTNTKLINAKNLILPAITLTQDCYSGMFTSCTNLITIPKLPATTLADGCYNGMFNGCTSLTTAPILPAMTLARACYSGMFSSTSITTAPILPATTLAEACYDGMFYSCTGLTTAPELPATTLLARCYLHMFIYCTNLNSITCLATNISATDCTKGWVDGVAVNGTFTKNTASTWTTGINGIPTEWTVETASN